MFVRFSFNLCYLSTLYYCYGTLQMLCWTHGIYEVCSFSEYLVGNETHTLFFILQAYFNCPATLSMATGLFPENCKLIHSKVPCSAYSWTISFFKEEKKFLCNYAFLVHSIIYSFRPLGFCSYFKPIS